tara:strand:- start:7237 stop:7611 length:375 start_codon:yes stop_codon:yes gene_type:complete
MRWVLAASAVLNSILLMTVTGVLPFFFFLSLLFNIGLIWYAISSFREYRELDQDLEDMLKKTFDLEEHLLSIYHMEMFYGDDTLRSLIEHTKEVVTELEHYRLKYSLDNAPLLAEEDEKEEENN